MFLGAFKKNRLLFIFNLVFFVRFFYTIYTFLLKRFAIDQIRGDIAKAINDSNEGFSARPVPMILLRIKRDNTPDMKVPLNSHNTGRFVCKGHHTISRQTPLHYFGGGKSKRNSLNKCERVR